MNKKIKEIQDIINKLDGKEILINKVVCLVVDGHIQYDYKKDSANATLSLQDMDDEQLEDLKENLNEELEYYCVRKPLKDSILKECDGDEIISFEDFFSNQNCSRYRILFKINNLRYRLYEANKFSFKKSIDVKSVELDADIIRCIRNIIN